MSSEKDYRKGVTKIINSLNTQIKTVQKKLTGKKPRDPELLRKRLKALKKHRTYARNLIQESYRRETKEKLKRRKK